MAWKEIMFLLFLGKHLESLETVSTDNVEVLVQSRSLESWTEAGNVRLHHRLLV